MAGKLHKLTENVIVPRPLWQKFLYSFLSGMLDIKNNDGEYENESLEEAMKVIMEIWNKDDKDTLVSETSKISSVELTEELERCIN